RTDIFSEARRSEIMSHIRGRDTKPELMVRSLLHSFGYRYRVHRRDLRGCPDIVFPSRRALIFVHGFWWHLHSGCPPGRLPSGKRSFWQQKHEGNRERDRRTLRALRADGWRVLTLWECEIERDLESVARRTIAFLERA